MFPFPFQFPFYFLLPLSLSLLFAFEPHELQLALELPLTQLFTPLRLYSRLAREAPRSRSHGATLAGAAHAGAAYLRRVRHR